MRLLTNLAAVAAVLGTHPVAVLAQDPDVTLHVSNRWRSSAIQLDSSLTQDAWHQFTTEMALVSYLRPLTDARPLGRRNFELSLLMWRTGIDETDDAWNDTFVHPNSTHWLTDGGSMDTPGLMVRAGVSEKIDVGAYFTNDLSSNHGLWGAQVQYNVGHDRRRQVAASARLGVVFLFGPADVGLTVYGIDLVGSKTFVVRWASVSPYLGFSSVLASSHEKSQAVNLDDEDILAVMGTIGAVLQVDVVKFAAEYTAAEVNSLSFKIGAVF
jgi:hypothetical protein